MAKPTVYTQEMYDEFFKQGYWDSTTWAEIWDQNALQYPNKEAVVDSRKRLTWKEAKNYIDRWALGFLELGLKRDDTLVVQLPNCADISLLRIASEKAGIVSMLAMRHWRQQETEYALKKLDAVGVVIIPEYGGFDYLGMIKELQQKVPTLKYIFVSGNEVPEGTISLEDMAKRPLEEKYSADYLKETQLPATELSVAIPTTGTTGFPKFVEVPICMRIAYAKAQALMTGLTTKDITGALVPPAVAGGPNATAVYSGPLVGAKLVFMERWDTDEAFKLIESEKITHPCLVPAQMAMMLKHPNVDKYDLSSIRVITVGGADVGYELAIETERKWGCFCMNGYGLSEAAPIVVPLRWWPQHRRFRGIGAPRIPGSKIKLVDDKGNEVPAGEIGELWIGGTGICSGYYKDNEATWEVWTKDGWVKTGDMGQLNEYGDLTIAGRKKDMIIRGGQNIYPGEIEDMLRKHSRIIDVAVVQMPDPIMGERACAYVVLKEGEKFTLDEMVSFLKDNKIASYKLPERLEFIDQIPLTTDGGKVDKKVLTSDISNKLKSEGKV
jgi:non-ribosomal peptide synthetase component E (peptide arylation enzyme)